MPGMGSIPPSEIRLSEEDFAARLVRMPKRGSGDGTGGASFSDTLSETIRRGPDTPARSGKASREEKRLWEACIEMESLLVGKMLKVMRNTVDKTGWINGGHAEEIFEDMLYDEYALSLSRNSNLGLSKMLYDEMKRRL